MDKFIRLTIVTTGEDVNDRFNVQEPLRVAFNRALQSVGGGSNKDQFTLEYQDQPLDVDRRIEEFIAQYHWVDGTVLELVPRPEVVA